MKTVFSIFTRLADWLTYGAAGLSPGTKIADTLHFFVEDITKIFALLVILIYLIALVRASLDMERVRRFLHGKNRFFAYFLATLLGALTPFCSCSSIPVFIGFTSAGIPVGITMAFLITSPIINEAAVLIMGAELGMPFMLTYLLVGIVTGMIGGLVFDLLRADRFLIRIASSSARSPNPAICACGEAAQKARMSLRERHRFAEGELKSVLSKVWYWVIIGIGVGAFFHGWVPSEWIQSNLSGGGTWWTVPLASLIAIPLYSDATAIIPIAQSMMSKGLPLGTTLTFMLSVVGASLPGFVLLKQVMKTKLLIGFFILLLVLFSLIGWLFNALQPFIL